MLELDASDKIKKLELAGTHMSAKNHAEKNQHPVESGCGEAMQGKPGVACTACVA